MVIRNFYIREKFCIINFFVKLLIKIESTLVIFLSTNVSMVLELTLEFPTILTFLISAKEIVVNIKKNSTKNLIKLLNSYKNYML